MPKDKGLPAIFITVAALVLLVPFAWKFAPLLPLNRAKLHQTADNDHDLRGAAAVRANASTQPATSPTPATAPIEGGTFDPGDLQKPTPLPAKPSLDGALSFIDKYLALGNSNSPPYGREDVINFPMQNFYGEPITHEEWIARRGEFNRKAPIRYYTRLGTALFTTSEDNTKFSAIIPIAYVLKQADGTTIEGISIDRIGASWTNGKFGITSHENLCTRVTRKNQVGIVLTDWRKGRIANSRDGSTNLRYEDSDKSDASILKSLSQSSPIQYLPEDDRWLIVKDEAGIVGFVARNLIELN